MILLHGGDLKRELTTYLRYEEVILIRFYYFTFSEFWVPKYFSWKKQNWQKKKRVKCWKQKSIVEKVLSFICISNSYFSKLKEKNIPNINLAFNMINCRHFVLWNAQNVVHFHPFFSLSFPHTFYYHNWLRVFTAFQGVFFFCYCLCFYFCRYSCCEFENMLST